MLRATLTCIALVLMAVIWAGCSGEPAIQVGPQSTGAELYVGLGCAKCHGADLEGLRTAPPLDKLAGHYDETELISFLKDPAGFEQSARLQQMRESFPLRMPPVTTADDTMMHTLAGFLLAAQTTQQNPE